jgi:hypothetical protein
MSAIWERYRRTLIPTQVLILSVCAIAMFALHVPWQAAGVFFLVMQLGAVLGAAWGVRIQRKITNARNRRSDLPLGR